MSLMGLLMGAWVLGERVTLRKHRLKPLLATAVISVSALLVYVPLFALTQGTGRLLQVAPSVLWTQIVVQGLIAGTGTLFTYATMVMLLGPARAAIFPALAPGLAALLAWPVLGHVPGVAATAGLFTVMAGLLLAVTTYAPGWRLPVLK
jgi:uncharacterized membrane protein